MQNTMRGAFELKVGEKVHDCNLNLNAFRILTQKFGIKLAEIDKEAQENPLETIPQIAWCGCLNAAMRKAEKFEMDFDTFAAFFLEGPEALEELSQRLVEVFAPEDQEADTEEGN